MFKTIDINKLSNYIRQINGDNRMGAGTLAEKIVQYLHEQSPEVEPAIQVKPLEWVVCGDELHALKKNYKIREVHDRHSLYFRGGLFGRYPSLDEAKEAAQKDYDSKILSCLSVTAKPEPVECDPDFKALQRDANRYRFFRDEQKWLNVSGGDIWDVIMESGPVELDEIIDQMMKLAKVDSIPVELTLDEETRRMVLALCHMVDMGSQQTAEILAKQIRERIRP